MDQFKRMQKLAGLITEFQLNEEEQQKSPQHVADMLWDKFNGDFKKIDKYIDDKLLKNINRSNISIDKVNRMDEFWKKVYKLVSDKSQMYEIGNKISYEEAEDILSDLRSNDSFQHDIFGKIEDEIRDNMGEDFDEDDVYNQAVDYMIERLVNNPNIWDEYL